MIQCLHRYRPASFEALVFLVRADEKDRVTQLYVADMLRLLVATRLEAPPPLYDMLRAKPRQNMTAKNAESFVDNMIRTFGGKGGRK